MLKKCKILCLFVAVWQVNLVNAGFSDLFRALFINAPAAVAVSVATLGRWYLNTTQIAEMKKIKLQIDQSNQNLAKTALVHERALATMGLVRAKQESLNTEIAAHESVLRSVQEGQAEIKKTQTGILDTFRVINCIVDGLRINLHKSEEVQSSVLSAQDKAREIIEKLNSSIYSKRILEKERQAAIDAKFAEAVRNQRQFEENLRLSIAAQASLHDGVERVGTHMGDIEAKQAKMLLEQAQLQAVLLASKEAGASGGAGAGSVGTSGGLLRPPVTRQQLSDVGGILGMVLASKQQ